MIISTDSSAEGNRDGPKSVVDMSVRDAYDLIGLKVKIYFMKGGSIGQDQIKKGYEFGVLISLARDADRKNFLFEIAVGPAYDQIHIFCQANDIDLVKALGELANQRKEQERLAESEKKSS
ncbi:MAG: hypothetical protein ABIH38_05235 [Patescibacteria group bacterium]